MHKRHYGLTLTVSHSKVCHSLVEILSRASTVYYLPSILASQNKLKSRHLNKLAGPKEGMSKQDIANWTQRVEDEMEPGGNEYAEGFDWARLHENWDEFMLFAKGKVMASSTKARIGFISGRLVPLALKAGS